jgi:carbon storage regulator
LVTITSVNAAHRVQINLTGRCAVLVLTRKKNGKLVIGDNITITVVEIRGDKVRIGIEAPKDVTVHREEVYLAIAAEKAAEHLADPDCD